MGLIGLMLLIGACSANNDDTADESSLNAYFNGLQALSDEMRNRADSLAQPASSDNHVGGAFNQSLDIFRDFLDDVRDLNPPSEAQDAHDALVSALDDFIDGNEELIAQLADVSTAAEFGAIPQNTPAEAEQAPVGSACDELQRLATNSNIGVNLDCGGDDE